ncbi:MAG: 2-C-methyl-D-erythritol 4-phosphate cytidylyltransferase [Candidatus Glassbacteria bacterium]
MVSAVIVAAGEGKRYGGEKQFESLEGKPVIWYAVNPFLLHRLVEKVLLVVPGRFSGKLPSDLGLQRDERLKIVAGGERRQDSVYNGLCEVPSSSDIVLVHDGVRPLLDGKLLDTVIKEVMKGTSVVPVIPVSDTVKEIDGVKVERTLDRHRLCCAQTPQAFPAELIRKAHERARAMQLTYTDDAQLVESLGQEVRVVPGDRYNLKITSRLDLELASLLLRRVGGKR